MATAPALPGGFELPLEPRLPRLGSVDAVALEERAAMLATRSIKKASKVFALDLAIRAMDLTTLEGADTPGKVAALATKGIRPDPTDTSIPSVAAICVYPNLVRTALDRTRGTNLKPATGKAATNATLPIAMCMLEVIRDVYEETGRVVGMKVAGGVRQAKQAVQYLVQVHETLGVAWLTPDRYRIGASTLLNDILMQLRKERTGRYQNPDYFTVD